ncbi:hypothetical protein A8U91_01149 [Halomonas elongata]|uniref:histidine kinase n=1 Tax=Halomonas elongata TaxID=2746 RepID=A0A1B8P3J8_HALEL|nr:sensor histidine kinase N-terminal domain-containing protein [Halomonas elongata]OBX36802.1 hypothetical protein A8U91_01149 [Halomonas elongata]
MITRDSLYRRLLTWLLLPMVALGGLMLFQAWIDARQTADRAFDRLLEAATLAIAEQVQWQDDRLWLDLPPAALEMLATDAEERVFYAIYDNRGRFVTGNAELPGASDEAIAADGGLHYRDIQWHGMALREGIRRTRLEDWRQRERFDVRVAHTREGRERLASQLLRGNLAYILGMALLAAATLVIAIRTALAPLTRLRRAIRARDPRTLAPLELPLPANWPSCARRSTNCWHACVVYAPTRNASSAMPHISYARPWPDCRPAPNWPFVRMTRRNGARR